MQPISKEILKAELSEDKRLRFTNKSHNEIYVITYQDSPNVMKEIGRLREIAFRAAGGGTGKAMDIDEYDVMENPYKQLVVWNPEAEEILGGYRYLLGDEVQFDEHGKPVLATAHMFNFVGSFFERIFALHGGRWDAHLLHWNISQPVPVPRDCLLWIICGMVWAH